MLPVFVGGAQLGQFVEVRRDPPVHVARSAGGLALVDVDGDGKSELFVGRAEGLPDRLLHAKDDGTFEDQAAARGLDVLDETLGAIFDDLDGDGRLDAVIFGRGVHLLRGVEGPTGLRFDLASDCGIAIPDGFDGVCSAAAVADVDGDGDRDLFVATRRAPPGDRMRERPFPLFDAMHAPPRLFFRNEGGTKFRECAAEVGLRGGAAAPAFATTFEDIDGDGAPDLLIASECGRSLLFRNDGKGRFHEAPLLDGGAIVGDARILARGDLDGSGRAALLIACASDSEGAAVLAPKPPWLEQLSPRTRSDAVATARGGAWQLGEGGRVRDVVSELGLGGLGPFTSGVLADLCSDPGAELLLLSAKASDGASASKATSPAAATDARFWNEIVPAFAQEGVDPELLDARLRELQQHDAPPRDARLLVRGTDGKFADATVDLSALRGATSAIAWDFDGDGDFDIAALGDSEFEVLILRNDRDTSRATAAAPEDRGHAVHGFSLCPVVAPKVPAPAVELTTLDGQRISIAKPRRNPTVLLVDRHDAARIIAGARAEGAKDVVIVDAESKEPGTREAIASLDVLVRHLVDRAADSAIVRVDPSGLVDALIWDCGQLVITELSRMPSQGTAGRFLTPPPSRGGDLAGDYLAAGLPQQALAAIERWRADGLEPDCDFEEGRALSQLKRLRPALEKLQRVKPDSRDYGLAQLEIGRCQARLGQRDEALKAFEAAIAARPSDPAPYFERGRILLAAAAAGGTPPGTAPDKETLDRATESLRTATYLRPDWSEAQVWFGQGLALVGRRGEAEQAFARAAAIDPKDAQPHFELAKLKLAMGQRDAALAEAQRSLDLAPGNPAATKLIELIRAAPERAPAPKDGAAR
jgi:Flp pilus assembly protein TadD